MRDSMKTEAPSLPHQVPEHWGGEGRGSKEQLSLSVAAAPAGPGVPGLNFGKG